MIIVAVQKEGAERFQQEIPRKAKFICIEYTLLSELS